MKIFAISLSKSKRRKYMRAMQLKSPRLEIELFDAINGEEVVFDENFASYGDLSVIYDRARCLDQHRRLLTKGEVGCALSHLFLYQRCVAENCPAIMILEDDARFLVDDAAIQKTLSELPSEEEWDVCYVQDGDYHTICTVNTHFERIRHGAPRTHGYIVSQRGAAMLCDRFTLHSASDGYLDRTLYDRIVLRSIPALVGLHAEFSLDSEIARMGSEPKIPFD